MSAAIKSRTERYTEQDDNTFPIRAASTSTAHNPACAFPFARSTKTRRATSKVTLEENPPVRVYDTSGPWGDPSQQMRSA